MLVSDSPKMGALHWEQQQRTAARHISPTASCLRDIQNRPSVTKHDNGGQDFSPFAPNGPGQKSPGKAIYCCHSFENAISRGRACAAMQGSLAITQPQLLVPSSQPIHQAILPLRELLRMSKGRTKPRFPALRSPTASCEMTGQLVIEQKGPTEPAGMPDISAATRDSQSCPNS